MINEVDSKLLDYIFGSDFRSSVTSMLVILTLWLAYRWITRILETQVLSKAFKDENSKRFLGLWRMGWWGIIILLTIISFSGSLTTLGISAWLIALIIGWSLRTPVTNIAAWLMIIIKKPFKIGDRITMTGLGFSSGVHGDVHDISLTHVHLIQVGGTIDGEEKSGRFVFIPNILLFKNVVYNYTYHGNQYNLDEILFTFKMESDINTVETILLDTARQYTESIIQETEQEPYVYFEVAEAGLRFKLRYQTSALERQKISSEIYKEVFLKCKNNKQAILKFKK